MVAKLATFQDYDDNVPIIDRATPADLTWMSARSPACAALTNLMKKTWDGELDENIRCAMKSCPPVTTALDIINATDSLKTHLASVQAEYDLAQKSAAPGVSTGAAPEQAAASAQ